MAPLEEESHDEGSERHDCAGDEPAHLSVEVKAPGGAGRSQRKVGHGREHVQNRHADARRHARKTIPEDQRRLKERLENGV